MDQSRHNATLRKVLAHRQKKLGNRELTQVHVLPTIRVSGIVPVYNQASNMYFFYLE